MIDHAYGHVAAGLRLLDASRAELASQQFERALAIDPTNALAHAGASWALVDLGRYDEARARAGHALELDPDLAMGHAVLGRASAAVGLRRKGIAELHEAIRLEPTNAGYYGVLSMILLRSGRAAEGEAAARDCLRLDPGSVHCLNNLAASLIDRGRVDEARPILLEALRLEPDLAFLHANLGTTQLHAGDRTAAEETMRESLRLDPMSTSTIEMLRIVETTRGPIDRFFFRLGFRWREAHPVVRIAAATIVTFGGMLTLGLALVLWALLLRDAWGWLERTFELRYHLRALRPIGAIVPRTAFGGALVLLWLIVALILAVDYPIALILVTAAMAGFQAIADRIVGDRNKPGLRFLIWFAGVVGCAILFESLPLPALPLIPWELAIAVSVAVAALVRLRQPILVRLGWREPPIPAAPEPW